MAYTRAGLLKVGDGFIIEGGMRGNHNVPIGTVVKVSDPPAQHNGHRVFIPFKYNGVDMIVASSFMDDIQVPDPEPNGPSSPVSRDTNTSRQPFRRTIHY